VVSPTTLWSLACELSSARRSCPRFNTGMLAPCGGTWHLYCIWVLADAIGLNCCDEGLRGRGDCAAIIFAMGSGRDSLTVQGTETSSRSSPSPARAFLLSAFLACAVCAAHSGLIWAAPPSRVPIDAVHAPTGDSVPPKKSRDSSDDSDDALETQSKSADSAAGGAEGMAIGLALRALFILHAASIWSAWSMKPWSSPSMNSACKHGLTRPGPRGVVPRGGVPRGVAPRGVTRGTVLGVERPSTRGCG
jgi:hypothetical protein